MHSKMGPNLSSFFAALFCALALSTVSNAGKCSGVCRFKFCNPFPNKPAFDSKKITLHPPGVAGYGPLICLTNFADSVGFVKTGEPIVFFAVVPEVAMSKWKPSGLSPRFRKRYFRTKDISILRKSGIQRVQNKGNQWDFLAGICVKLPVISYQVIKPKSGKVVKVVKTEGNPDDCVSFGTRLTKILIELTWEGDDDLDVKVTEPDKQIIDRFKEGSTSGNLVSDKGGDKCFTGTKSGSEVVLYRQDEPMVQKGKYRVDVIHFTKCGPGSTKWNLRISFSGEEQRKLFKAGESDDINGGNPIFTRFFVYP